MHARSIVALLVILSGITMRAEAQRGWQSEVGIRGGFTRAVRAGTGAGPTDAISLPGFSLGPALPLATGVYAVIPWSTKIAIEADVAASQLVLSSTATLFTLGLRGDYAVTKNVYVALGGGVAYGHGLIRNETQLGAQAALGYRRPITSRVNAHLEARTTFWRRAKNFAPVDAYSLLLGLGATTGRGRVSGGSAPRSNGNATWRGSIGVAGGYADVKIIGGGSVTTLAFPGYGSALGLVLVPEIAFPPTIFLIVPLKSRIALEPAMDVHQFQESGRTVFSGSFSSRIDYAIHRGWYGAVGGNLHVLKSTGTTGFARTGANLGAGYRFNLSGSLDGRVEMNFTMFARNRTFGSRPANTFGLMLGVSTPLK